MLAGNPAYDPALFDSIATFTGNGSASSFTFSSIPSNFTHLQLRLLVRGVRAFQTEQLYVRLNGDSGNNYAYQYMFGDGSGSSCGAGQAANGNLYLVNQFPAGSENANIFSSAVVDILDVKNTSKNKSMRGQTGYDNNNSGVVNATVWASGGLWVNTAAVTSVTVLSNGAFATGSSFALYGIRE
jgi:hypothetical protein